MSNRQVITASPCGFCSGVRNALTLIEKVLAGSPGPVYVLRGLIHNSGVTAGLKARGCIFADRVEDIPAGAETVFGAHGVPACVERAARERNLRVTDATCPLVKQLQQAASRVGPEKELVLFGHRGHPELEGVLGHAGTEKVFVVESPDAVAELPGSLRHPVLLVQTTLNHIEAEKVKQALEKRFPAAETPGSICRASFLRQQAVRELAPKCDLFVVAGSAHSSNANRLREVAESCGVRAVLLDSPDEVTSELLRGVATVGLSAAASTPESQIEALRRALQEK